MLCLLCQKVVADLQRWQLTKNVPRILVQKRNVADVVVVTVTARQDD